MLATHVLRLKLTVTDEADAKVPDGHGWMSGSRRRRLAEGGWERADLEMGARRRCSPTARGGVGRRRESGAGRPGTCRRGG